MIAVLRQNVQRDCAFGRKTAIMTGRRPLIGRSGSSDNPMPWGGLSTDEGPGEPLGATPSSDMLLERGSTGKTGAERFAYHAAGWSYGYNATEPIADV